MFKPNQYEMQKSMMQDELQFGREQSAMQMDRPEDEMVALDRKERTGDLTRWQQEMEDEVEKTVHDFRREYLNENEEWTRLKEDGKDMKPLMNEKGIASFRSAVRPLINRNLMMSNYSEDRIFSKLKGIVFSYVIHMSYHYKEYEIEEGNLSMIIRTFKDIIEPAHWRCLNNGERSYLNTINKRVEAFAYSPDQQQPKGKGWFGNLLG